MHTMNEDLDTPFERTVRRDASTLLRGIEATPKALEEMGYTALRPSQEGPVRGIMACSDTIAILPTGQGKSLIYGLPTKALGWQTVVVSPLKALMRDQVQGCWDKGIEAATINSDNSGSQNKAAYSDWLEGKLSMLFLSPEALESKPVMEMFEKRKPDMMVFDEAHMISTDGGAFRPAYRRCSRAVRAIDPNVLLACTATATDAVLDDIKHVLGLGNALLFWYYEPRHNLHLSSMYVNNDDALKYRICDKIRETEGSVIVYADTLNHLADIYEFLFNNLGEEVVMFSGSMDPEAKKSAQDRFMGGSVRVIVATNAFGMGVDKPDIRCVIHAYPPGSLEAVAQETGRASRDGKDAQCIMFYSGDDSTRLYMARASNPMGQAVYAAYSAVKNSLGADGKCRKKVKDLLDPLYLPRDSGIEAALPFLEARGIIYREKSDDDLYTVTVISRDGLTKAQEALLDAVETCGVRGVTADGLPTWKVSLIDLQRKLIKTTNTVKTNLSKLNKMGHIAVEYPFTGLVVSILKPCTRDICDLADRKRADELYKVKTVWEYCRTPDNDKQKYLDNYFELVRTNITDGHR